MTGGCTGLVTITSCVGWPRWYSLTKEQPESEIASMAAIIVTISVFILVLLSN
ncbi:MAG: DUF3624 family protein [Planctomycetes bacterium]|nr:DUF3624 family protein [Planctomycetota bacterium]MBL7146804.1 DUF3624 family protein [Phycisphaerae bacterium]